MAKLARRSVETGYRAAYLARLEYLNTGFVGAFDERIAAVESGETIYVTAEDLWLGLFRVGHPDEPRWLQLGRDGWIVELNGDTATLVEQYDTGESLSGGRNQQRDAVRRRWTRP